MKQSENRWKNILPFCLVVLALLYAGWRWGGPVVQLVSDPVAFREWVEQRGAWGPVVMAGAVTLQILVALIPGEPFEFAAGYAFGAWQGLLLCQIGSFAGSCIAMLLARRYGMRLVKALFPKHDIANLEIMRRPERLTILTFILFLIPGTPKDVMVYALGLTPMPVIRGVLLTCLARVPSILTSTLSGHALGEEQYAAAVVIYGMTAALSLIAVLIYRHKKKHE